MSDTQNSLVYERLAYATNLVTQGAHRFYSSTVPSDILAACCFATPRKEDPIEGFQRTLDKKRAQEIADYIDQGLGTIPSAIILSAQPEANLEVVGKGKTINFDKHPRAFLIIDGQHRVYGFSLAKTPLRVPVVIYNKLTKSQEAQLFIDINTTQRPVPSELLLDIKKLAERESDSQEYLRQLFDNFATDSKSCLLGFLTPSEKAKGKISRVTFNAAITPLLSLFSNKDYAEIYTVLNAYLSAFRQSIKNKAPDITDDNLNNPVLFRAIADIFRLVAQKIKDRHGVKYTYDNFMEVIDYFIPVVKQATLKSPGPSYKSVSKEFEKALNQGFTLF